MKIRPKNVIDTTLSQLSKVVEISPSKAAPSLRKGLFLNLDIILNISSGERVCFENILPEDGNIKKDGYELNVKGCNVLDVEIKKIDGGIIDADNISFDVTIPLLNYHQVIIPDCGRNYALEMNPLSLWGKTHKVSAPNYGHPLIVLTDQTGRAVSTIGMLNCSKEVSVECIEPGRSDRYTLVAYSGKLTLRFKVPSEDFKYGKTKNICESLYFGKPSMSWFHALRDYTDVYKERKNIEYTIENQAYGPAWCSWTAWLSSDMDQELVWKNAQEAKKLGIKNILIDDGWFGPGLDVDGVKLNIGDYYPDETNFPDLPGLVEKIQSIGSKAILWVAPLACAEHSKLMQKASDMLIRCNRDYQVTSNGFYNLCPCHKPARDYICSEVVRMVKEYGVDGFKHDLYNCLPITACDADHQHDTDSMVEGLNKLMSEIWTTLRKVKPNGILELKQNYGNVDAARFGSCVRAGDTPYDIDLNLMRSFYAQAYAGVVWNDYLAWSRYETCEDLGRMLIKMITAGVPSFSVDLLNLPQSHKTVLGNWLGYYNRHIPLWKCQRQPQDTELKVWQIDTGEHLWVSVAGNSDRINLFKRRLITISNAGHTDKLKIRLPESLQCQARTFTCMGTINGPEEIDLCDHGFIYVPGGGRVEIETQNV